MKTSDKLPHDIVKRIVVLHCRGKRIYDICRITGEKDRTVKEVLNRYIAGRNHNWTVTEQFERIVIKLYKSTNVGSTKLGKYFGVNEQLICRILKRNNIPLRKPNEYRKHLLNEQYFDICDSEEKAYIIGFLLADGCISRDRALLIRINKKDVSLLNKIKQCLNSTVPIKEADKDIVDLTVHSRALCDSLSKYGIVSNKTFKTFLPDIPKHLIHHFIRGYFDGDGSITVSDKQKIAHISIAGTLSLLTEIQNILIDNCNLNKTKIIPVKNIWRLNYGGSHQIMRIYDYLYKDATIYLERKRNKFTTFAAEYKLR